MLWYGVTCNSNKTCNPAIAVFNFNWINWLDRVIVTPGVRGVFVCIYGVSTKTCLNVFRVWTLDASERKVLLAVLKQDALGKLSPRFSENTKLFSKFFSQLILEYPETYKESIISRLGNECTVASRYNVPRNNVFLEKAFIFSSPCRLLLVKVLLEKTWFRKQLFIFNSSSKTLWRNTTIFWNFQMRFDGMFRVVSIWSIISRI